MPDTKPAALHCYNCHRPIGSRRCHILVKRVAVMLCLDCVGARQLHTDFIPECPHPWHDLYDHPDEYILATNRRAAIKMLCDALTPRPG
jgi:hypothetical protein